MDVIYTGLHRTAEEVVIAAIQEDVDILGISILSGAHMTILPKVLNLLEEQGSSDIMVVAGGVIPAEDIEEIQRLGVKDVLLQDTWSRDKLVVNYGLGLERSTISSKGEGNVRIYRRLPMRQRSFREQGGSNAGCSLSLR